MTRRLLTLAIAALALGATPAAAQYDAKIDRTAYGIPHITADSYGGLAYGYAYALAEDNFCVVQESYVTVRAERSRYFGADKGYVIRGNGSSANNLNSDFFYKAIIDEGRVERLVAATEGVNAIKPELREGVKGYVAGWNRYLSDVKGADGITDPACKGKPWVQPITEMDVYRRFYSLALLASSGVAIDGIAGAAPATGGADDGEAAIKAMKPGEIDERLSGLGSNAMALGRQATVSGNGMLYGNPHFPWEGPERFYQSHLVIPGKLNVAGGSLLGVPLINIGWTEGMAWSHTVSTARRFTPFELKLVPGSPTTYYYDGQPREMVKRKVTVKALNANGTLSDRSKTLYWSHHGPILTGILGLPIFPWTSERAYAMGDANAENFGRLLNHFFDFNHAQTVEEGEAILKKYVGIPWVNTIVADTSGDAYYADIGSIPNVSMDKLARCRTALGVALDQAQRLPVLDGSTSACEWDTDADAPAPGIFGPGNLPSLKREDYTANMNDSYWLTNPRQPIEGYSRIIGDERTQRSLRTRGGIWLAEDRLAGRDGLPGNRFTLDQLTEVSMSNRVPAAELWKEELVAMCKQLPFAPSQSGPVSTAGACEALEGFNGRDDLDSKGAILFRRFAGRALSSPVSPAPGIPPWTVQFNAADPVNTPRGLNTASPQVRSALGDAINDLKAAGIPLDAPLRGHQFEKRGDREMPIHGGPGTTGVYNVISAGWNPGNKGYGDVSHGSSHVQAVELTPGCPRAKTILTYSQSSNPNSPHYGDMTELYESKGWVEVPFCGDAVTRASLRSVHLVEGRRAKLLRGVRVTSRRGRAVRVSFTLARKADVTVVARKGSAVRRATRRGLRAGRRVVTLRLRRGTWRVTVTARAGARRETARLRAHPR